MAETTLQIAGRHYPIRCRDGEEAHLARLAGLIEEKARQAQQGTPGLTEVRTLLFAALFMADELSETRRELAQRPADAPAEESDDGSAAAIEALAARIEKLCDRLAPQAVDA